ncbi:CYTH domain-containing protein [Hoeflea sp.]|uniref:CYTH domain-containing protein n=1 Tax=Hoeflea sp. TaxID=1940281 RepID=UPI003A94191E
MALEIERKFLVENDSWRDAVETSRSIVQAYVAIDGDTSLRVRIYDGTSAWLTVKVGVSEMTRHEFQYPVPLVDAREMADASRGRLIEKTRHIVNVEGFAWEVDVYEGRLAGLVTAEVEMGSESDAPALPPWLGREVTGEAGWSNAMLAINGLPADFQP